MIDLPHFAWPIRYETRPDGTIGYALVEQDTTDDHHASAAVIASTPRGHRDDEPDFGVTELAFQHGPINTTQLAEELAAADDRLDLDATELIDLRDAMRREVTIHTQT